MSVQNQPPALQRFNEVRIIAPLPSTFRCGPFLEEPPPPLRVARTISDNHIADLIPQLVDLRRQFTRPVRRDTGSNHRSAYTTRTPKSDFARHIDVRAVLIFGEKGYWEDDVDWRGVGRDDYEFGGAAIKGFDCYSTVRDAENL
jgi:hypothetical protein